MHKNGFFGLKIYHLATLRRARQKFALKMDLGVGQLWHPTGKPSHTYR
jgi:hypothetical protein